MLTLEELIPALSGLMSVTGFEGTEKEKAKALVTGYDECVEDAVGNLIFIYRCGRKDAPRILIDTHFDEIGMMVTDVKERGFLAFTRVGGLDLRTLSSADVLVWGDRVVPGVVTSTPPHLAKKDGKPEMPAAFAASCGETNSLAMVEQVLLSPEAFCTSKVTASPSLSVRASTKPWVAASRAGCCTSWHTPTV